MKPLSLFLIASFVFVVSAHGQKIWVEGRVLDAQSKMPIPGATIQISAGKQVSYAIADSLGNFHDRIAEFTQFKVLITSSGQQPLERTFPRTSDSVLRLGEFFLIRSVGTMATVTVKTNRIIVVGADKVTYYVKSDTTNRGLTAFEIVQKAPYIEISADNKMYVSGQGNFRILIDGKLSGIANQDPVSYLKSLPSKVLERIQVLTDPPLKYRQEGVEKIVNIITDKNLERGFYLSANGGADTRRGIEGGYFMLFRSKKFSLGSTLNAGKTRGVWSDYDFESTTAASRISQTGRSLNYSTSFTPSVEAGYEIDSLKLLSVSGYGYFNSVNTELRTVNRYLKQQSTTTNERWAHTNRNNNFYYAGADYEHIFKNTDRKSFFTFSSKLLHNMYDYSSEIKQWQTPTEMDFQNKTNSNGDEITNQLDIVTTIGHTTLNGGYKNIQRLFHSGDSDGLQYVLNQQVSVPYFDLSQSLGSATVKAGVNIEGVQLHYYDRQGSFDLKRSFMTINPRVGYFASTQKNESYSLTYSLLTKRPTPRHLSPVVSVLSPDLVQVGNPSLKQELVHSLNFSYNSKLFKKFMSLSFYSKFSDNSIVESRRPFNDTVLAVTYLNSGNFMSIGNTFYWSTTIKKNLSLRFNTDVAYQRLWVQDRQQDALYYKLFITAAYRFPRNFSVSLQNFIYSKTITYQGYLPGYPDIMLTINKKWLKGKLSTSVTLYQPFLESISQRQAFDDIDFHQTSVTRFRTRYVGLRASYDLGNIAKAFGARKKQKGINNDDLKE